MYFFRKTHLCKMPFSLTLYASSTLCWAISMILVVAAHFALILLSFLVFSLSVAGIVGVSVGFLLSFPVSSGILV